MIKMRSVYMERVKFFLLIFLITASLIQVGILWDNQNHGLPINVFTLFSPKGIQLSASDTAKYIREKYFTPYRIIVSDGYDNPRWIIEQDDTKHLKLWSEAQFYLKKALAAKPVEYLPDSEWGKLIANRSIIFEFRTNVKTDVLSWFSGVSDIASEEVTGLYKMIISPAEDLNYNTNTVYLRDDKRIYKYTLDFTPGKLTKADYIDLFTELENDKNIKQYSVLREKFNLVSIDQDILGVMLKGPKFSSYSTIDCSPRQEFKADEPYTSSEVDSIADTVLGADKFGYDRSWDENNTIELKTLNNIYRIYNDGFLEYKYLGNTSAGDKGSLRDAFVKAVTFMERLETASKEPGVELYLSGMDEKAGSYRFVFDYTVDGLPVFFDYTTQGEDKRVINNAFDIEVSGNNVVRCYGLLKSFRKEKEAYSYNINFPELMNDAYSIHGYTEFKDIKNIKIKAIDISYKVEYSKNNQKIKPVWVIRTDYRIYTIPMSIE